MTEAEAKLINAVLYLHRNELIKFGLQRYLDAVDAERSRHPYGSIAESMMVELRKPEPSTFPRTVAELLEREAEDAERAFPSYRNGIPLSRGSTRDVCDPAPRKPPGSPDAWRG